MDPERQPLLHDHDRTLAERPLPPSDHTGEDLPHEHARKHGIVTFDPDSDPLNPQDWPPAYRWGIVLLLACQAFSVTFACIGIVPVANRVVLDLEGAPNKQASVLFVTIWELGEAAGPLVIGPLSERYGRYPVFNVANALFVAGVVMTALAADVGTVIFARFLTGCAVASNVLGPAVVGDIMPSESRGKGMSAILLAPLLGGAVGPAIAGAIAETAGWREILWMAAALGGACELAFLTLFRETYKIPILRRKAARLREETGDKSLRTEYDAEDKAWGTELGKAVIRPIAALTSSPILAFMSLWGGVIFSFYYVMVTTLPDIFEGIYGFDAAKTGSAFLSFSKPTPYSPSLDRQLTRRPRHRLHPRHHRLQHRRRQTLPRHAPPPRRRRRAAIPGRPAAAARRRRLLPARHGRLLRHRAAPAAVRLAAAARRRPHGLLRDPVHRAAADVRHGCVWAVLGLGADGGADDEVSDGDLSAAGDGAVDRGSGVRVRVFDFGGDLSGVGGGAAVRHDLWGEVEAALEVYQGRGGVMICTAIRRYIIDRGVIVFMVSTAMHDQPPLAS